jgi:hypothetical protein
MHSGGRGLPAEAPVSRYTLVTPGGHAVTSDTTGTT